MNKKMLFLLMCVSPVILNGILFKAAQSAPLVDSSSITELQRQVAELTKRSEGEFVKGLTVAGIVGAMAYYFLPKAKNRFHLGMGTLGAAAAGYGVNCYYDTLAALAKDNPIVRNPWIAAGVCAGLGTIVYNHEAVKTTVASIKDTIGYRWLFEDLPTSL